MSSRVSRGVARESEDKANSSQKRRKVVIQSKFNTNSSASNEDGNVQAALDCNEKAAKLTRKFNEFNGLELESHDFGKYQTERQIYTDFFREIHTRNTLESLLSLIRFRLFEFPARRIHWYNVNELEEKHKDKFRKRFDIIINDHDKKIKFSKCNFDKNLPMNPTKENVQILATYYSLELFRKLLKILESDFKNRENFKKWETTFPFKKEVKQQKYFRNWDAAMDEYLTRLLKLYNHVGQFLDKRNFYEIKDFELYSSPYFENYSKDFEYYSDSDSSDSEFEY